MRDKAAIGAKFQRSGLIVIAAVEAMSTKCQMEKFHDYRGLPLTQSALTPSFCKRSTNSSLNGAANAAHRTARFNASVFCLSK